MGSRNIIELNGNYYDSITGEQVSKDAAPAPAKIPSPPHNTDRTVDGFIKRQPSDTVSQQAARKKAPPSHKVHGKQSRSKTLMRHAVKKPDLGKQSHNTATATSEVRHNHHDRPERNRRLLTRNHSRSSKISKFSRRPTGIVARTAEFGVRPEPSHQPSAHSQPHVNHQAPAIPETPKEQSIFDEALENATSHEQPKIKKPALRQRVARKLRISPKSLNIAAGIFIAVFVGGLVAYRSIPQLALQLASTRAGVKASMPDYQPAGFAFTGPIEYTSGTVTLNYASNSDERNFQIVQKSTDWSSQALLENFVVTKEPYQTFQDKGRTVYTYGNNSATWVSGGIWYQVESEAELSSDQLRRIVSGL